MDDDECQACGSSLSDREKFVAQNKDLGNEGGEASATTFADCPHCGSKKCCMCDMGDDVECLSCDA